MSDDDDDDEEEEQEQEQRRRLAEFETPLENHFVNKNLRRNYNKNAHLGPVG
jgi:hypothetical protein